MAPLSAVIFVACLSCAVICKPIEYSENQTTNIQHTVKTSAAPRIWKRFINPSLTVGSFAEVGTDRLRTKRDAEECEKLQLCKLHAESGHSFAATFELYFVNKENARLWDHRAHTIADCKNKYSGCLDDETPPPKQTKHQQSNEQQEVETQKEQEEQNVQEADFVNDDYES